MNTGKVQGGKTDAESQSAAASVVQCKLAIGAVNDPLEAEADSMADKIMRMPEPTGIPVHKYGLSNSIQRKCADCEEEEQVQRKPLASFIQRKESSAGTVASDAVSNQINSSKGSGNSMDGDTQSFMQNRFGTDFSDVKIHTGGEAIQMNRELSAKAFTVGNDIYFNEGQYNPGSGEGKHLLAHELTHTVQQGGNGTIRRKIQVGGSDYTPTTKYLTWLKGNYGQTAVDIINMMHKGGNMPLHQFASFEALGYEIRIRNQATKGMEKVHAGCCNYPSTEPNGYLDPVYWDRKAWMDFTAKSPLPSGKKASDAIEAIFASGAGTQLECLTMTVAIEYYSLLKGLGTDKFNQMFPGGAGLVITVPSSPRAGLRVHRTPKYEFITASKSELLPGDWVYFKNFSDYTIKHPGGLWQGENAIVMGPNKFSGFGAQNHTEDSLNDELVKEYNDGLPAGSKKSKADLLAQGGGLKTHPVIRPVIKEILK